MIDGGTALTLLARYTVVVLPVEGRLDGVAASWIGTKPEFAAWELIGTITVSVVWPAGKVTVSFTGVNGWPTTSDSAAIPVSEPLVAEKSTVSDFRAAAAARHQRNIKLSRLLADVGAGHFKHDIRPASCAQERSALERLGEECGTSTISLRLAGTKRHDGNPFPKLA